MTNIIDVIGDATVDKGHELVLLRDRGLTPSPELLRDVRARYLLALRGVLQGDEEVRAVVTAAVPATDAFDFVEKKAFSMVREGTEDIYRDAIMFLLAELDELRGAGDRAYVVDTSTGEIVAPVTEETIVRADRWTDEDGVVHLPGPSLNPEIALALILKSSQDNREADIRRRAADPKSGFAYKHLTEPQRILEIAASLLEGRGHKRVGEEDLRAWGAQEVIFGAESTEADLQSTNPLHHRLWSYSSILAKRVSDICGRFPGARFWFGPVRMEKDDEARWYAVSVKVEPFSDSARRAAAEGP